MRCQKRLAMVGVHGEAARASNDLRFILPVVLRVFTRFIRSYLFLSAITNVDGNLGVFEGNYCAVIPCLGSLVVGISRRTSRWGAISRGNWGE